MGASREEIERLEEMSEYWWWEEEEAFIQFYAPFFARPFAHRSPSAGRATREPSPEARARWDMDGRGDLEHQPVGSCHDCSTPYGGGRRASGEPSLAQLPRWAGRMAAVPSEMLRKFVTLSRRGGPCALPDCSFVPSKAAGDKPPPYRRVINFSRAIFLVAAALAAAGCGDADLGSLHSGASLVAGRPFAEAVTPRSTMRVDQFAIRAAARSVPAPEGTGLPNVRRVVIDPLGVVPLSVHLEVEGMNNEAWQALGWDGQTAYGAAVLAAIAEVVPPLPSDHRWRQALVLVKVWARTREPITLEEIDEDEDDPYCFYKVRVGVASWDCYQPSVAVAMEAPRED